MAKKFLSIKELTAVMELIVGSLCMYNFCLIDLFDEKFLDMDLFRHRCVNVALGFMNFFNAVGTWFWFSNIRTTKMLLRVHKVIVYIILNIFLLCTHFSYKSKYFPVVWGYFDKNIFFDEEKRIHTNFIIVLVILALSVIIVLFNVNYIVFRVKHLLRRKSRSNPVRKQRNSK